MITKLSHLFLVTLLSIHVGSNRIPRDVEGPKRVSNRIKSGYSSPVQVYEKLDLWCSLETSEATPESCTWTSPDGTVYKVDGDKVSQDNHVDEVVDGILANVTSGEFCHIQVSSLKSEQIGDWTCHLDLGTGVKYQRSTLTVTDKLRISDVRLPGDLKPTTYKVALIPFIIPDNFTIDGHVDINLDVVEETAVVKIHAKDLTIYEESVEIDGKTSNILGFGNDHAREFFLIYLSSPLPKGSTVRLSMDFLGSLSNKLVGFYRSKYISPEGEDRYIATTQFEATDARRAFPCFDEPAMKAKFRVLLGRVPSMVSLSNMPIEKEAQPMDGNATHQEYVWDIYQESVVMSTYLLAFIVSDFKYRQSDPHPQNDVQFRIWSRESAVNRTEYASQVGPEILAYFEDFFGLKFPLPKQDMIAIPDFSGGAMENWGLITYRERGLLYDSNVSSDRHKLYIDNIVAHELAHQWFGNLVTMKWWTDLWLNEGFATYAQYIGSHHVNPEAGIKDKFVLTSTHPSFKLDALETSHPISVEVGHPDDIGDTFDTISYRKGASVIRMMANFIGVDTFNKAISNYLKKYQFSNAEKDDLWQEITETAHADEHLAANQTIKEIMDTWTLQKGFPVMSVSVDLVKGQMTCNQSRYLASKAEQSSRSIYGYKWWIPVSYTKAGGDFVNTRSKFWLKPMDNGSVTFDIEAAESDAIIVNVRQTGFYRVNYDSDNWKRISEALESDLESIHRVNRAQILNDAFNLAKVGLLSYEDALIQTQYLSKEKDLIPWSAALSEFSFIGRMLKREKAHADFEEFLQRSLTPIYSDLGFSARDTDTVLEAELRVKVVGRMCGLDNADCINRASDLFQEWMKNGNVNPIDPDFKSVVYCSALRHGDATHWNFLWDQFKSSDDNFEMSTILSALGCSKDEEILQKYLDLTLDKSSGIRKQDGSRVVGSVARTVVGKDLVWKWIKNNWDQITTVYDVSSHSTAGGFVSYCVSSFNKPERLAEAVQFYETKLTTLGAAKKKIEIAIQKAKVNVEWMEQHYQVIANWLKEQVSSQ
ncbi:aminopeptidase N-like isoform X2 [Tigriopus californicus]|nr:aminopeptidase N-like isoform X2 [Tigriopus californicus]